MSDNLISRKELKSILSASESFKTLSDDEKLYIIYEKLQSLEELYREEKNLFSTEKYVISPKQVVVLDNMMDQSNGEDFIGAYYSLLEFLEDDGQEHDDIVYVQELDELYFEIKKLILLIEQNIDFEETFPKLIEHFSVNSMIQFSLFDSTSSFNDSKKAITLNGSNLNISWQGQDYDFNDLNAIEKVKEVIIQYRKELYDFSKRQEDGTGEFDEKGKLLDSPSDECVGAIDGILFSVSNQFNHEELNDFYSNLKISLYHVLDDIIAQRPQEEESVVTKNEEGSKQKKIIAEMLDIELEEAYQNSVYSEELDAIYYWNPNGSSVVIDSNLHYLLTNTPIARKEALLNSYRELKQSELEETVTNPVESNLNELTVNMLDEINHDYQLDRNIDNVFDFADSLIDDTDLDVFWKRVSADMLGYIIVKELEDNNLLDLEQLKNDISSFNRFSDISINTELQSKNKKIVNISTMTRQAPEKTLRTIYDIICKSLNIEAIEKQQTIVEEQEMVEHQEPVEQEQKIDLVPYTVLSDTYYNFVITLPASFETVIKNSESSFKIGDINIMIAKCSSVEKLEERSNQWLENSARTNSQIILSDLDREYYLGDQNLKVLEKQLEKNEKRRTYKFIYFNGAMLIFAYSSLNTYLSEIIDEAIVGIQVLANEEEQTVSEEVVSRKLKVEYTPFHESYDQSKDLTIPEPIVSEYTLLEDLEVELKDFKLKVLELSSSHVRIRIYDNHGVVLANNTDFKVDYQVGDYIGNVNYNQSVELYRNSMGEVDHWRLFFE